MMKSKISSVFGVRCSDASLVEAWWLELKNKFQEYKLIN